jgi:hypothetical protein
MEVSILYATSFNPRNDAEVRARMAATSGT